MCGFLFSQIFDKRTYVICPSLCAYGPLRDVVRCSEVQTLYGRPTSTFLPHSDVQLFYTRDVIRWWTYVVILFSLCNLNYSMVHGANRNNRRASMAIEIVVLDEQNNAAVPDTMYRTRRRQKSYRIYLKYIRLTIIFIFITVYRF